VWRRTNRRLKDYAPKGGGFYHHALKGTKEFTDNKKALKDGNLQGLLVRAGLTFHELL
jgi:hypothetical protein